MEIVISEKSHNFRLSFKAIMLYAKIKNMTLYPYVYKKYTKGEIQSYEKYDPKKHTEKYHNFDYFTEELPKDRLLGDIYNIRNIEIKFRLSANINFRSDPDLIYVIKKLGKDAEFPNFGIKIITVPDDNEYKIITTYDGEKIIINKIWE
jgi:hypothetical protein